MLEFGIFPARVRREVREMVWDQFVQTREEEVDFSLSCWAAGGVGSTRMMSCYLAGFNV